MASQHFPEATQIVDLYHAREHLHDLGKLAGVHARRPARHLGRRTQRRARRRRHRPRCCQPPAPYPLTGTKAEDLDTALGYFETNAPRMRYKHFRSCGLFVGSGAVEAGCKAVIGQRLKQSGMHWPSPARAASSPCAASKPAAAGKKSGSNRPNGPERPDRHLTTARTQTIQARPGYRPVTYIRVPHPRPTLTAPRNSAWP